MASANESRKDYRIEECTLILHSVLSFFYVFTFVNYNYFLRKDFDEEKLF